MWSRVRKVLRELSELDGVLDFLDQMNARHQTR
jgi:hypothetical protein